MLAPMRPTPTKAIFSFMMLVSAEKSGFLACGDPTFPIHWPQKAQKTQKEIHPLFVFLEFFVATLVLADR